MSERSDIVARKTLPVIVTFGIHLRPAQMIAQLATRFRDCEVTASKDGYSINAKSIMGLTELAAGCGEEVEFEFRGKSAQEGLDQMEALFLFGFDVEDEIDPRYAEITTRPSSSDAKKTSGASS